MNNLDAMNDMDSLLDGTLDDLADAPTFKPFAAGAHMLKIAFKTDEPINNIPTVKVKLTHVSTEELTNPDDVAPVAGDQTEVAFMLKDKDGKANALAQGQLKELLASLKTGLGLETATNREVMAASEGLEVLAVTTVRKSKPSAEGEIKYYTSLKSVSVI